LNSSNRYPNIVFVVSRFPFPLEKGDKLRAYHQIKELSNSFSVHLIALTDSPVNEQHANELERFCASVSVYKLSKISIFWNSCMTLFGNKPIQVGYFFNKIVFRKVQKKLKEIEPIHIVTQLIRTTEYTKNYHNCPKTLDYMDALSKGIERRIGKEYWYLNWIFRLESKRLRNYERSVFDYFEYKTIISEQDRNLIFHPERMKITCVPNGIDNSFFEYKKSNEANFELVFVGNMSYAPNIEASKFLANSLLPRLQNCKLLIAGATPHSSVQKLAEQSESITISGWLDDIREAYCDGKIFIAPMMIGTGMQNKLLEAMALGIPCITTTLANNAIHAVHNQSIIVANTTEEMIFAIQDLLSDVDKAQSIGMQGKEFVKYKYSWRMSTKNLVDVIKQKYN